MKRGLLSVSLAVLFVLSNSGVATAVSANISPHSQSHPFGQASSWTATWGDNSPYNVVFHPDTANPGLDEFARYGLPTLDHPQSYHLHSMAFYPCTQTTYTQQLVVDDKYGSATHFSTATEGRGNPCSAPALE